MFQSLSESYGWSPQTISELTFEQIIGYIKAIPPLTITREY